MKKILVSVLAIAGLVACNNEDVVREQNLNEAITFDGIFVENATRANDPSIKTETIEEFFVWAYMNETTGYVFNDERVYRSGGSWTYDHPAYWLPGNHYYFAAFAGDRSDVKTLPTDMEKNGLGVVEFTNVEGTNDILYSEFDVYVENKEVAPVKFQFEHLLSKVKFTFANGLTNDNNTVVIKNIKMTAPAVANIDLSAEPIDQTGAMAWTNHSGEVVLDFGAMNGGANLARGDKASSDNERLTIPAGADKEYKVTFDVVIYYGDEAGITESMEVVLNGFEFVAGRAYNLVATITQENLELNAIEFDVVVDEWITSETPDSQVEEAELIAALQLGGEVTLNKNLTLTQPLVIPAGVTSVLNLNGFNVVNETKTLEYGKGEGIVVYGDLTINGEGLVKGSTRAVWARGTEGATVTINGGTYEGCETGYAEGGNSVIYASSGNVINIYGGTFKALAEDTVSYANPTYAVLNVADNNGMINVYGGEFYKQNPAAPGTEPAAWNAAHPNGFVAEGYFANKIGDNYVVADGQVVATADELAVAVENGAKKLYLMDGTYTLAKYPAGIELVGYGDNVVFDLQGKVYGVNGGDVAIENVKLVFSNANYKGFQHTNVESYKNCTIVGQPFLYGNDVTFEGCTFEQTSASAYNVWTYGAKAVKFVDCVFNSAGKSVLIYAEGSSNGQVALFEGCTLNASAPVDGKAAIEIDSSLIKGEFNVVINDTTANGFANGNVSGNSLWNNKMGDKTNITVDGVEVL